MRTLRRINKIYWICRNFVRDELFEPVWYRFFGNKHHIIKTNLKPGSWIEVDTRMLYGVMSLVEWFVENDMQTWSEKEYEDDCKRIKEDDPEDKYNSLKGIQDQYARDKQILSIYSWWKAYPNRLKEIKDASHRWHVYYSKFKKNDEIFFSDVEQWMSEDDKKECRRLLCVTGDLEEKLANEEQEMLKLAVELRGGMWS